MSMRIYTDGSCLGNPGPGGWAWIEEETRICDKGGARLTTNQVMELCAVLEALWSHPDIDLTICTDSAYIVNCFKDEWYDGWTPEGIKLSNGEQVKNWDLWKPILDNIFIDRDGEVIFEKVKAHSGVRMNEHADELAREQADIRQRAERHPRGILR